MVFIALLDPVFNLRAKPTVEPHERRYVDISYINSAGYVHQYNTERLHSAIGYVTPLDKLNGRAGQIFAERDAKLAQAREARRRNRATG